MKMKGLLAGIAMLMISFGSTAYCQEPVIKPLNFYTGIMTGFNRGFGIQANITAFNFPKEFPLEIRFGIGLSVIDPGNPADARRIFVNNATDGVPEKTGRSIDFRFDFLTQKTIFGNSNSYVLFGPRFSTFRGRFNFVDGNEVFDVFQPNGELEPPSRIISD